MNIKTQLKGEVLQNDFLLSRDRLDGYRRNKILFKIQHGYELNLKSPESFNEKIVWKKMFDRNPLIPFTADKYKVRSYVRKILGRKSNTIHFNDLPDKFVIKTNHGSRMHIIVNGNLFRYDPGSYICQKNSCHTENH